jgi:hypothetical protein
MWQSICCSSFFYGQMQVRRGKEAMIKDPSV